MIHPFLFVATRTFKNRLFARLRKLRNARYLISFVVAMAYFWFTGFRHLFNSRSGIAQMAVSANAFTIDVAAVVVLCMMILAWALPEQEAGLKFSEAEINFLFPAPLTRRQLLIYKILRQQPQVLISSALISFFGFRRGNFVGLWISFVVLAIYFTFTALGRARLKLAGIGFLIRLVVVTAVVTGVAYLLWSNIALDSLRNIGPSFQHRGSAIASPFRGTVAATILFVPRLFSRATFSPNVWQLMIGCGALLVFGAILLELALRMNVSFEDASIRASQKQAGRQQRRLSQRVGGVVTFPRIPPPFRLSPRSGPMVAIFWKNLTAGLRIASPWLVIMFLAAAYFVGQAAYAHEPVVRGMMGAFSLFLACMFPFLGSRVFAQDMRLDLARIELLKSYPISGDRLVAAEIAAPIAFVAAVQLMLLSAAAIILSMSDVPKRLAILATPEFIVIALMFAIPVCALQLLIHNAVPILLPGWAMRGPDEQRGFVVMGQRVLMLAGNLLILAIALVPPAAVMVPAFLIANHWFSGSAALVVVATVPSAAILVGEVWIGVRALGAQFEKLDVTNEIDTAPA
ncbi:MAG: putative ABC exporter domain-containing protein [Acidobacteriota bacterium]